MSDRNPFVIPDEKPAPRRGCPQCGGDKFSGYTNFGIVYRTCRSCGCEWQGGIGQLPQDPTVPVPPTHPNDRPNIEFVKTKVDGDRPVPVTVRRPDLTPAFRKGAPIPGDDDGR